MGNDQSYYIEQKRKAEAKRREAAEKLLQTSVNYGLTNHEYGKRAGELLAGYDHIGRAIGEFLYEGRPKRSRKKEPTREECLKFLEQLRNIAWNHHKRNKQKLK